MSSHSGSTIHVHLPTGARPARRPSPLVQPARATPFQRKAAGARSIEVPDGVDGLLRSPGRHLPPATNSLMGERFGRDFSQVRVHTDATAAESARRVDAHAYTVGNHIAFAAGRFSPTTTGGQRLLAHELAHVVQQGGSRPARGPIPMGTPGDAWEAQADRAADAAVSGRTVGNVGGIGNAALQRAPATPGPGMGQGALPGLPPIGGVSLPLASIEIDTGESITKDNPKLVSLAQQAKAGSAWVTLSAYLSQGAKNSSAAEQTERSQILQRMYQIREVLQTLGVPADRIDVNRPTGYATSAHGQVSVTAKAAGAGLPAPAAPIPGPGPSPGSAPLLGPQPGPPIPGKGPSLGDLLTVKFGPVTVDLPASIKAKLPIAISAGKSLVIELSTDVPTKFEFRLTLDGTPRVRVSAGVSAEYDPDKKSAMGSAGLRIETVTTTCHATNPEEVRAKIKGAGDKLMKAGKEFGETTDSEGRLKKLADIAGAIAEMYDAVDKSKAACKQEPRAKFEFGTKFPLAPGSETDRTKLSPYVGGTVTIPF